MRYFIKEYILLEIRFKINFQIGLMTVAKKKRTNAQKKKNKEYMTVFIQGKQVRIKRPLTIEGIDVDEFIRRNADPIWLHQAGLWEYMDQDKDKDLNNKKNIDYKDEIHF